MSQTDTSRFAYEVIMRPGARESVWKKIIECFEKKLKDATNYEIADALGMKPEKIWKRTGHSELSCKDGALFDTGLRRNSPDGNPCIVYSLSSRKEEYAHIEKPERVASTTTADYANAIIASTAAGKRLFEKSVNDDDDIPEFQRCSDCDGHDACEDFGCAIKLGVMITEPL